MRRFSLVFAAVALVLTMTAPVSAQGPFPDVLSLPDGFFPEGIATGDGTNAFVGSLVDGAVWKGDLRTGDGEILVEGVPGRIAVGLAYDAASRVLYVAGGPDGNGYLYDGDTGALLAVVDLVAFGFVNDVVVTKKAAYFTDSSAAQIYEVPLTRRGTVAGPVSTIPLTGDFRFEAGQFNANGIEATSSGGTLVVVNSFFGEIYTVDSRTGEATIIDLGGAVVNGDGLVLAGTTLYAVEGGKNQITKISLAPDLRSGVVVDALTSPAFDVPTTAAPFGRSLYAVNAKFSTPPTPSTPYEIVRVDR